MRQVRRVNSDLTDIDDGIFRAVGMHVDLGDTAALAFSAGATVVVVNDGSHIHFITNDSALNLSKVLSSAVPMGHIRSRGHVSFHPEAEQFALQTLRAHMNPVLPARV